MGARKMAKSVAAAGPVEGPWALPDGWRWERLGRVLPLTYGKALKASERNSGQIPVYGSAGITGMHDSSLTHEPSLIVGRKGSAGAVYYAEVPAYAIDTAYFCARSSAKIDLRFGFHLLTHLNLRRLDQSTAVPSLGRDTYNDLIVPIPPERIQTRLAARIDQLFDEIGDGEAALARARADMATWRKALLKAAAAGELTADWRAATASKETGGDLLDRILAARRTGWSRETRNLGKRYTDAAAPMLAGMPGLPIGWAWVGIEQLTTGGIRNGLSLKEAGGPTAVKGLKLDALQPTGIDWSRTRYLPIGLDRAAPYLLKGGDLLISRANGSPDFVGRCTMVDDGRDDTVFPDTAIRYPIADDARLRAWARLAWNAPQSRAQMLALAKSTAGILKISQGDIAAVALPLPPMAEIEEIVARVERLTAEAEAGADDLVLMKFLPATLRQSVLAAAFRGELA